MLYYMMKKEKKKVAFFCLFYELQEDFVKVTLVINGFLYVFDEKFSFICMEALACRGNVVIGGTTVWKDFSRSADNLEALNSEHQHLDCKLVQQSN